MHYVKRGASNALCYGTSSIITRIVSFLFLPYFLSKLTLEEFGVWDFYQTFFSLGTLILSSCAATAMMRYYLFYQNEPAKQQQSIGNALLLTLITTALFLFILLSISYIAPHIVNNEYLYITIANICSFSLFSLVLAYLRMREQLWLYCTVFCSQNLLAVALTVLGVHYGFGIKAFFYANCISFLLFIPWFIYLLTRYCAFSVPILKEQMYYSVPLLLNGILYVAFFSIDRFFIQRFWGYETLGMYSLLWRFGAIFQFFSIALMDAWPIVIFNAQKEKNGDILIAKLVTYVCLALTSGALGLIVIARYAIDYWFPYKYHTLIMYLPFFFVPITVLEVSRLLGAGFGLSRQTVYEPIIACMALVVQSLCLICFSFIGLWGILIGNTGAFLLYGFVRYRGSTNVYSHKIINIKDIIHCMFYFMASVIGLQFIFLYAVQWYWIFLVGCTWLYVVWLSIIEDNEKEWVTKQCINSWSWVATILHMG